MRERGADRPSFDADRRRRAARGAAARAADAIVGRKRGDVVVIDWGAMLDGYCSDCTRTVAVGEIGDEAREAYELVLRAQLAGLDAVRAGADGRATDAVARDVIAAAGHGEHFGHGLGHGVGLEIHEAPRLAQRSTDTLTRRQHRHGRARGLPAGRFGDPDRGPVRRRGRRPAGADRALQGAARSSTDPLGYKKCPWRA